MWVVYGVALEVMGFQDRQHRRPSEGLTGHDLAICLWDLLSSCRCPGRHFAEVEVGLLLGLLLTRFKFCLVGAGPCGGDSSSTSSSGVFGKDRATNGSDAPGGGSTQEGLKCSGRWPGDPQGLLPPCDMTRLVGLKVPARPCWVRFERRALTSTAC